MDERETAQLAGRGLAVTDLTVWLGDTVVVDAVTMVAPHARITALIGPNGAGKSTLLACCSGLVPAQRGHVALDGVDITNAPPYARAQRGLGRTFQRVELCETLSVRANIELGYEARRAAARPWRHIHATRAERRTARAAADAALDVCGLAAVAGSHVGHLSIGMRRQCELARVIAGGFTMLLLDEPSAGLDPDETDRFRAVVHDLVRGLGVGVLLVGHDVDLVMGISDEVVVLDEGHIIFCGDPVAAQKSSVVRDAYFGHREVPA